VPKLLPALLFIIGIAAGAAAENSEKLVMKRLHQSVYYPGDAVDVQIVVEGPAHADITAMGLRETLPAGWSFVGLRAVGGAALPEVSPQRGSFGTMEFIWINPPATLPYSFVYTVQTPEEDAGAAAVFAGELEYRAYGPAQFANPVVTTLNKSLWKEGYWLGCGAGAHGGAGGWTDLVTILAVLCVLVGARTFQPRWGRRQL
jgi:hypothetical protein